MSFTILISDSSIDELTKSKTLQKVNLNTFLKLNMLTYPRSSKSEIGSVQRCSTQLSGALVIWNIITMSNGSPNHSGLNFYPVWGKR